MVKKIIVYSILAVFLSTLTGCASMRKQKDLEMQGLRNQITVLEEQIQSKEEELDSIKSTLTQLEEENNTLKTELLAKQESIKQSFKKKAVGEVKSRPNAKQIQIALVNAGYDAGDIDGRLGKKTRRGIKAFQRDRNLRADGKVGKETWNLLKDYLYKKEK